MFECNWVSLSICWYTQHFKNLQFWFSIPSLLGQFFPVKHAAVFVILCWAPEQHVAILLIWISPSPYSSNHSSDVLNSNCLGNWNAGVHIWHPQIHELMYLSNNLVFSFIKLFATDANRVTVNFVPTHLVWVLTCI